MRLSTRSEYGLRAMVALARKPGVSPVPLRILAEDEGISEQYLEQIFVELRRAGVVLSAPHYVTTAGPGSAAPRRPAAATAGDDSVSGPHGGRRLGIGRG